MVIEGDLTWGGEHTVQGTGDVLWNCAPDTCVILQSSVTPINTIKGKHASPFTSQWNHMNSLDQWNAEHLLGHALLFQFPPFPFLWQECGRGGGR